MLASSIRRLASFVGLATGERGSRYWIITLTSSPLGSHPSIAPDALLYTPSSHTPGLSLCTRPPFGAPDGAAIFQPEPTLVLVSPVI